MLILLFAVVAALNGNANVLGYPDELVLMQIQNDRPNNETRERQFHL